MSEKGIVRLRELLEHGRETSLEQVQALVQAEPLLLHEQNTLEGNAIFLAIRNECPDEVTLYLLRCSFPLGHANVNNVFWKVLLLAALDVSRQTSMVVVRELLKTFPQWFTCQNFCEPYGHVFYWALVLRPDIACYMVEERPEIARLKSGLVGYPIHAAAKLRDNATIEVLVRAYPDGLHSKDSKGRLPLHLVLSSDPRVDIDLFHYLADKMPKDFFYEADETTGHLFLHQVAASDTKFTIDPGLIQALIARNPEALMRKDKNGNLPLHLALDDQDEAYTFVSALMAAAPTSLMVPNRWGRLPIHVAVSKFMVEATQEMIDKVPQTLVVRDVFGQTPLHIMLDLDMFDKFTAERMISLHPEILLNKDFTGKVPLHYAVDECQYFEDIDWLEVVELLSSACPEAAAVRDNAGKTPFHYAVSMGMPFMVMRSLFRNCAAAAQMCDSNGNPPLVDASGAIYRNPDHSVLTTVYMLVRHDPGQLVACYKTDQVQQQAKCRKRKRTELV